MEWQPIETAPKDGSRILLVVHYPGRMFNPPRSEGTVAMVIMGYWREGNDLNKANWMDGSLPAWNPSHWMPLPELPGTHIHVFEIPYSHQTTVGGEFGFKCRCGATNVPYVPLYE